MVALLVGTTTEVPAQLAPVGSVDFYGVRKTPIAQVRDALGIAVGDSLSALTLLMVPGRLADIPGVMSAAIDPVCCEDGKTMLYVGIAEEGAPELGLRAPPDGASRLAPDVVATGHALSLARERAIMRGITREDVSEGHSLMSDSAARALQLRYVALAARDLDSLRTVLRTSADPDHRALAAEVLGYAADKRSVVDDLVFAMRDPSAGVRNSATRALALIAGLSQKRPDLGIRVPYEPFVDLLNSLTWSDRNKASLALMQLTETRDAAALAALKTRAFDSIVDLARWTNPGHAMPGIFMLARIAGIPDGDAYAMFERGEREKIIDAATKARSAAR
ncbi:MAG: hypothetical protein K0S86_4359 [Geminicoccaceae bacterium]|nr:hypothetical protein [Geminicoccaceae bacterium]